MIVYTGRVTGPESLTTSAYQESRTPQNAMTNNPDLVWPKAIVPYIMEPALCEIMSNCFVYKYKMLKSNDTHLHKLVICVKKNNT